MWSVNVAWRAENVGGEFDVDVDAFLLDETDKVASDQHFIFYNNPADEDGATELSVDGDSEHSIWADLDALPAEGQRVVIAAAVDDERPSATWEQSLLAIDDLDGKFATFVLDLGTVERTMVLTETSRRAMSGVCEPSVRVVTAILVQWQSVMALRWTKTDLAFVLRGGARSSRVAAEQYWAQHAEGDCPAAPRHQLGITAIYADSISLMTSI